MSIGAGSLLNDFSPIDIGQDAWPKPTLKCGSNRYDAWSCESSPCWRHERQCSSQEEKRPLTVQFRQILKTIVSTKESMGDIMKTSSFSLTEAKYVAGDNIKHVVLENVKNASLKVRSRPRECCRCEASQV